MIQIDGIDEIRESLQRLVPELSRRAIRAGAQAAFDTAQREADTHTKTGALARSVRIRPDGDGYIVGHDLQMAPHALFVHWGTRPHEIRPRTKSVLRWPGNGAFIFAQRVQHPGYAGDPWMLRAREAAIRAIQQIAGNTQ